MKNKFENYTIEEFMKLCFADDSGKCKNENEYRFWKNFKEININVWDGCPKIYNYSKNYNALPDPDINSFNLYEAHIKVWNRQCEKFKNENIKNIKRHGMCRCEVITEDDGKHNWVTEDCLAVYDLLDENNKKTLPTDEEWTSADNILPQTKDQWWTFYNNIILHLEARNEQITKLIKDK